MSNFEEDKLGQFKGLPKGGENIEKKKTKKKGAGKKKISDTDVVKQNREPTIRFREKGEYTLHSYLARKSLVKVKS